MDPIRLIIAQANTRRLAIDCDGYCASICTAMCASIDAAMGALMCSGGAVSYPLPVQSTAALPAQPRTYSEATEPAQPTPATAQHSPSATAPDAPQAAPKSCLRTDLLELLLFRMRTCAILGPCIPWPVIRVGLTI
jgi:hypothetical protein